MSAAFDAGTLAAAMQAAGILEDPIPDAARRWIETFIDGYGPSVGSLEEALREIALLRAEATVIPALELERLRNRQVVFFLDAVSQYVDAQPELRGLPLEHDLPAIAEEFGIDAGDARWAVRMALTGREAGIALESLFPLLGHERIMIRIGAVSSRLLHGRGLEPIPYGPDGEPFVTLEGRKPPDPAPGS